VDIIVVFLKNDVFQRLRTFRMAVLILLDLQNFELMSYAFQKTMDF